MRFLTASCVICFGLYCTSFFLTAAVGSQSESGFRLSEEDPSAHYRDQGFAFNGRIMFYNWGGYWNRAGGWRGLAGVSRIFGARVLEWEGDCDFTGTLSVEHESDSGLLYGADFQILLPEVEGAVESGKAVINQGSRLFLVTPYGKFSFGYQEGVESLGKLSVGSFDDFIGGLDPSLIRYKLPKYKSRVGFWLLRDSVLLYPGLYSESLFRTNAYVDFFGEEKYNAGYSKYFVNNLPFRISYQSPSVFGLKFGVSYSPAGYDQDLFDAPYFAYGMNKLLLNRNPGVSGDFSDALGSCVSALKKYIPARRPRGPYPGECNFSKFESSLYPDSHDGDLTYAPAYKNIISAAVSFVHDFQAFDGLQVSASLSGEYAPSGGRSMTRRVPLSGFHELRAAAGSLRLESPRGLSFGAGYGYWGSSGYPRGFWSDTHFYWSPERASLDPSYYWVLGFGYAQGPFRVESSYFSSVRGGYVLSSDFSDLGIRLSYELYRSRDVLCALFAQLHRVSVMYNSLSKSDDYRASFGLEYDFDIAVFGVRLVF